MLERLRVKVVVENADGAGILKCRADELHESTHSSPVAMKAVKFRVEFTIHASASPAHSPVTLDAQHYATCLTLVMEKGAHSSFKAVHAALRRAWECVRCCSCRSDLAGLTHRDSRSASVCTDPPCFRHIDLYALPALACSHAGRNGLQSDE